MYLLDTVCIFWIQVGLDHPIREVAAVVWTVCARSSGVPGDGNIRGSGPDRQSVTGERHANNGHSDGA